MAQASRGGFGIGDLKKGPPVGLYSGPEDVGYGATSP